MAAGQEPSDVLTQFRKPEGVVRMSAPDETGSRQRRLGFWMGTPLWCISISSLLPLVLRCLCTGGTSASSEVKAAGRQQRETAETLTPLSKPIIVLCSGAPLDHDATAGVSLICAAFNYVSSLVQCD